MKIEKAIEILEDKDCNYYRSPYQERREAEKLGIEALKRLELWRECGDDVDRNLLPGETEE